MVKIVIFDLSRKKKNINFLQFYIFVEHFVS